MRRHWDEDAKGVEHLLILIGLIYGYDDERQLKYVHVRYLSVIAILIYLVTKGTP